MVCFQNSRCLRSLGFVFKMDRLQYETVSATPDGPPTINSAQPQNLRVLRFLPFTGVFVAGALFSWLVQAINPVSDLSNSVLRKHRDQPDPPYVQTHPSAAVASDQAPCSRLGRDALQLYGGNAVDAAVVVGLCLGVVNPASSGLGGGAFATMSVNNETVVLDCREEAPGLASENMFQSASSESGGLAIPVFAELHCWTEMHSRYGLLPWKDVVMLVVDFAEPSGTIVGEYLATEIGALARLCLKKPEDIRCETANKSLVNLITKNGDWNHPLQAGDALINRALMETLKNIADQGIVALYRGEHAEQIVQTISRYGGVVSQADLLSYKAKWRKPIMAHVGDFEVISVPPPSSGGAAVIGILRFLLSSPSLASFPETLSQHRFVEASKHIFAIRMHFSDPDYNSAIVEEAVSDLVNSTYISEYILRGHRYDETGVQRLSAYGGQKWAQLNDLDAVPSHTITDAHEGDRRRSLSKFGYLNDGGTSHFCIVDSFGNAVSMTSSVNTNFGSHVHDPTTGIIFSNTMDDFSSPGTANHYGLIPAESNYVVPTKRPLSSMSPTLVSYRGKIILVIGGSGGPKIITAVSQVILRHLLMGQSLDEAVSHARIHNQLIYHGADITVADNVFLDSVGMLLNVSDITRSALLHRHQTLLDVDYTGTVQAISVDVETGEVDAACDPRKGGIPAGY